MLAYGTRIDGLCDRKGVATIESSSIEELPCLAAVADFLAQQQIDELAGDTEIAAAAGD